MAIHDRLPPTARRVEASTATEVNAAIRQRTQASLTALEHAPPAALERRLHELQQEWDIERVLQLNASLIAGLGVVLGAGADRRFLLLPTTVFGFLLQHALQGWCPPLPLLRRLGFRTTAEIETERYALRILRGDLDSIQGDSELETTLAMLQRRDQRRQSLH
jgi:hypothetical protein